MNLSECKERNEALREKNEELSALIRQFTQEPKQIGKILSGPFQEGASAFYRVSVGGQEMVVDFKESGIFLNTDNKLEVGAEVAVIKATIVGIVPTPLMKASEDVDFEHVKWEDIGGLKSQVERIRTSIEMPLKHGDLMQSYGLEPIKGILLHGAPGCGKTLIARAIASAVLGGRKATSDAFVYIKGGEMLSMYVGATEQHIGRIFKQSRQFAKKHGQRAVIFIDEADALLPARGSRRSSDVETTIVPTFLSEMDGFDGHSPIVVLSTNFPDTLDPAVLRDGRIDIKINIDRPTQDDAVDIFRIHLNKVKKVADKVDVMAKAGSNLIFANGLSKKVSGAMIQTAVKAATQRAAQRHIESGNSKGVTTDDIKHAIENLHQP